MNKNNNDFSHLTRTDREIIEVGIKNGSTKAAIAKNIGKDKSTVGKEIKLHRKLTKRSSLILECANYKKCAHSRECKDSCPDFKQFKCTRRDRSPGACNGCSTNSYCRFDKFYYHADIAQKEYEDDLHGSREGVNLTSSEAKEMADIIKPLLENGLSPYQILVTHPELNICEKTLYNYIEGDVFRFTGSINKSNLRRAPSRKMSKAKRNQYKKREDKSYLIGRKYNDYLDYIEQFPDDLVIEMDTVYNDVSNGPFIQTFKFLKSGILFAVYHDTKTADDMVSGFDILETVLGPEVFRKYCKVCLTDRGSEFSDAEGFEKSDGGSIRSHIFYCDAMASNQKGSLENKHIELRYILPKDVDLRKLGLTDQTALNLVLSHINSAPLESLGGKSALELTEFLYPDLYTKLNEFGINKVDKDKIILKPYLLRKSK